MPRGKKREDQEDGGVNRYPCRQDGGRGEESGLETEEISLSSLMEFLFKEC